MALDLYFKDDIIRILTAISSAGDQHGPEYQKALGDVALAFGINVGESCNGQPVLVQTIEGQWIRR